MAQAGANTPISSLVSRYRHTLLRTSSLGHLRLTAAAVSLRMPQTPPKRSVSMLILLVGILTTTGCAQSSVMTGALPLNYDGTFLSDGTTLGYTFARPEGAGPFPVVVLIHGSGRTTRDEMLNIVPQFLQRGIAVLRYDKRGVGESGGQYSGVGPVNSITMIPQLARDAAAAMQVACAAERIDAHRCGFFGVSQAGWVIVEALSHSADADFAVLYSGVTIPVGLQIYFSQLTANPELALSEAVAALEGFTGNPGYDPAMRLSEMSVPTLWLLGLEDRLLPNALAAPQLLRLRDAGQPVEVRTYPGYGHALGPAIWPHVEEFIARPDIR